MLELNPFQTLQHIAGGYCLPRCLHVVADLASRMRWTTPLRPPWS